MNRLQYNLKVFIFAILCSFLLVISGGVDASGETENLSGQAEVVWPELRSGNFDIYYSRLTDSGWTEKIPLSDSAETTDMMPAFCLGGDGVRWVVWTADSGPKSELFYCRSNEGGWTDPKKISTGLLFNTAPSIWVDQKNMPWIVWAGSNGKGSDIFFSRWDGHGWEQALRVSRADATPDIMPLIGVDRGGIPWVCWFGFDGDRYRPYSSKWSSGGWGGETESDTDNLYEALIAMGDAGGVPTLPGFVTDPEKACVHVHNRGQLQSFPIQYLSLGNLLTINASSGSETIVESLLSPSGELIILGFGDSITQGYPYRDEPGGGGRFPLPDNGYEPTLETLLAVDSRSSQVLNWGVAGEKTYDGLKRINSVLSNPYADYILILEGTNDYWHISYETTIFNLGWMIDESRDQNVTPILSTLTPDTLNPEKPITTEYNPAIRELAVQKGVRLADQYAALIGGWELSYTYDGLHPNAVGYNVMAQTWFNAIPDGPTVTTGEATAVGRTTARLNGTVNPNGSETTYRFEYGTTAAYGSFTSTAGAGSGTVTSAVDALASGLTDETLYHYRLTAANSGGTTCGYDRTFTTHRPWCDGCQGDVVVLENVTYVSGTDCECVGGTSITIRSGVIIESGAHVTFTAPRVTINSGFTAQSGAVVDVTVP